MLAPFALQALGATLDARRGSRAARLRARATHRVPRQVDRRTTDRRRHRLCAGHELLLHERSRRERTWPTCSSASRGDFVPAREVLRPGVSPESLSLLAAAPPAPRMTIDPDSFRSVLGRFASGVTVVTTRDANGGDVGMTVSAFSLGEPPSAARADLHRPRGVRSTRRCSRGERFGVNILAADRKRCRAASPRSTPTHRFDGLGYRARRQRRACCSTTRSRTSSAASSRATTPAITPSSSARWSSRDGATARPLLYYRGGYAQLER